MSEDHTMNETGTGSQIRCLGHVLERLDILMRDGGWDGLRRLRELIAQRVTVLADTDTDTDSNTDDGHGPGRPVRRIDVDLSAEPRHPAHR